MSIATNFSCDETEPRKLHAPLTGFSRKEYWNGLPCPLPEDFPNPGIELVSLISLAVAGKFFTTNTTWEAQLRPGAAK